MNRFRINQILDVLLFPYCDPDLQKKDFLYQKYCAYRAFVEPGMESISMMEERMIRNEQYKVKSENLVIYLAEKNHGRIKSYDDISLLCDLYFPVKEVAYWIEWIQKQKEEMGIGTPEEENIAAFYLNKLFQIASSMITYRDGVAAIRTWSNIATGADEDIFPVNYIFDKVEIWNMLGRYLVPDVLIAAFAVECGYDESALFAQKPQISLADKLLIKVFQEGIAENHLHFNAGYDYETLWINTMNLTAEPKSETGYEAIVPYIPCMLFRVFAAQFFQNDSAEQLGFNAWLKRYCTEGEYKSLHILYSGESYKEMQKRELLGAWQQMNILLRREGYEEGKQRDFLLYRAYGSYIELRTSSEFILLYHCCSYVKQNRWDTVFARMFLQYLRIKNQFCGNIQQNRLIGGLTHFQTYFAQARKKSQWFVTPEDFSLDIFRAQAKISNLRKLEIRIAPMVRGILADCFEYERCCEDIKQDLSRQLFAVLYSYRKYILESVCGVRFTEILLKEEKWDFGLKKQTYGAVIKHDGFPLEECRSVRIPTLGIVYHFLKTENLDDISGYACWKMMNDKIAGGSYHRLFLRQRLMNIAEAIEELRGSVPKLNEYVVGIDAASNENAMEPWMLSAVYNRMRSRRTTKPILLEEPDEWNAFGNGKKRYSEIQNIGFTYHVGEDFRHVLSGLRHIDEVIEEFHYKPGDRLGHAIALGFHVRKWVLDNEMVPLPVMEYMENLLWLWGKNVVDEIGLPIQLEILEERILKCAEKIYGNQGTGITVHMLYQAYKMKFLQEHKKQLESICGDARSDEMEPMPHCRYGVKEEYVSSGAWTEKRLLSANYCPVFVNRGKQVELVPVNESEIALYELLQEYLMGKVAKKGIYIETNPTSNLTIGEIAEFKEHPVFKMNPIEKTDSGRHHVLVTVNSDDPIIFNTNAENELAYIYYALERAGYDKEDILTWIKRVRANGIDASFIKKEKDALTMLQEIGEILDCLGKKF